MTIVEEMRTRPAGIALILLHLAVFAFVMTSVIELCPIAVSIIRQIQSQHDMILIGALVTAFIQFACISFWRYKAIAVQVNHLVNARQQYLLGRREAAAQSDKKADTTAEE